jgi:hypothetical protein
VTRREKWLLKQTNKEIHDPEWWNSPRQLIDPDRQIPAPLTRSGAMTLLAVEFFSSVSHDPELMERRKMIRASWHLQQMSMRHA